LGPAQLRDADGGPSRRGVRRVQGGSQPAPQARAPAGQRVGRPSSRAGERRDHNAEDVHVRRRRYFARRP